MARTVKAFPTKKQWDRKPSQWAKYNDGSIWKLKLGVDITATLSNSAQSSATAYAQRNGFKVTTSQVEPGYIYVQFTKR